MENLNKITTFAIHYYYNNAKIREISLPAKQKKGKVMETVRNSKKADALIHASLSNPSVKTKRSSLLSMISEKMRDEIYKSALECDQAHAEFVFESGSIEVSVDRYGETEVFVVHSNGHVSPTLEKAIGDCLPDRCEIEAEAEEDMREEQAFCDYLWQNCRYW